MILFKSKPHYKQIIKQRIIKPKTDFLANVTNSPNSYWLGLKRDADHQFEWADGTLLTGFTSWNSNNGNNSEEDCAIIGFPSTDISHDLLLQWFDVDCGGPSNLPSGYICQRKNGNVALQINCLVIL